MKHLCFLIALIVAASNGPEPMYTLEKLNSKINTQYDEINPVVSLDGKTIYFTRVGHPEFDKTLKVYDDDFSQSLSFEEYSDKLLNIYNQLGNTTVQDPVSSSFNQDIWIAESDKSTFDQVKHPKFPLNNALPNSVCAVTTDPSKIVIVNQFFKDGSMEKGFSFSRRTADGWSFPEPIFIYDYHNIDAGVNLNLSKDNEVMILSVDRGDGLGQNDLYVSFRIHTTLWSAPEHMGPAINTSVNEITPFISDDKQFLFFSSNQAGTKGGQDIFVTERLDESWTNWSIPQSLPKPINSEYDDAQPFFNSPSGYLYFTSTREGSSDIYRVNYVRGKTNKPKEKAIAGNIEDQEEITCLIVDAVTKQPLKAHLQYGPVGFQGYNKEVYADQQGAALITDDVDVLKLHVSTDGYIETVKKIDISDPKIKKEKMVTIEVDPLKVNTRISLDPIFFLRGKDKILSGSFGELDRLARILKTHPTIQVNINGHTDNIGDTWALHQLSEQRATAVKNYLVKSGIQSYRIKTKGYGPGRPITDNSSEKLRAQNRRVEVVITKV